MHTVGVLCCMACFLSTVIAQGEAHLVKTRGKEVERGENPPVGSQVVLLHHILVIHLQPRQMFGMIPLMASAALGSLAEHSCKSFEVTISIT
jgi:hypothetical protein